MPIEEIKRVCFVGGGTMGAFNSLLAASAGYEARVFDSQPEARANFAERQRRTGEMMIARRVLDSAALADALGRVRMCDTLEEAAAECDLVSESTPENLELKRETLRLVEQKCPPRAILTTNTSHLLASDIESAVERGEQFAALHSYLGSRLFDIVAGPRTSPATIDTLTRYVESQPATPIVLARERPGYLANTLFGALHSAALSLAVHKRGTPEEIDRAWMRWQSAPAGPFGIMDFVGLDVVRDVTIAESRRRDGSPELDQSVAFLQPLCEAGRLGVKTGEGFYKYPNPDFRAADFLTRAAPRRGLYLAMLRRISTAAVMLVVGGFGTAEQVETCWRIATDSPTGPLAALKSNWTDLLLDEFSIHSADSPDEWFGQVGEFLRGHL